MFGFTLALPPLLTAWLSSTKGVLAILALAYRGIRARAARVCFDKSLMLLDIFESAFYVIDYSLQCAIQASRWGTAGEVNWFSQCMAEIVSGTIFFLLDFARKFLIQ